MRSKNSLKNIIVNVGSQLVSIFMSFLCRTVFIWMLGKAYLSVIGLFTSILSLLSLAELGVGTAIIFSMYKPLAENDHAKVGALMNLYRRAYHVIGLVVAGAGLAFAPFYPYFIKDPPDVPYLTVIYLMYVFNSAITYFLAYKQNIIVADQKSYVCTLYQNGFSIAQNVLQIWILFQTKNFILYLTIQILFSFFTNFFLARRAERMYPYLKKYRRERLAKKDRTAIFRNIRAMFMHRVGAQLVNGTDNLVISSFVGMESVAIYSSYLLITTTLRNLTAQIFSGITASVGNLGAVESRRKSYEIYRCINFAGFWIFSFCSISLFCLFNPFIQIWTRRSDLLFPLSTVFLIVLNFYVTGMRQATLVFKDAFGLFWYDRYKALIEAGLNLALSLILVQYWGVSGVFLGTFLSMMGISFWVEPFVLFRRGFRRGPAPFFFWYVCYGALTLAAGFLTWRCCLLAGGPLIAVFALRLLICLVVPNVLYLLVFHRTREFGYFKNLLVQVLRKKRQAKQE